jgi:hypothetical protein
MYKLSFLSTLLLFVPLMVGATSGSGACSYHGGVDCSAGSDRDGSVICMDSWRDSSVNFINVLSCRPTDLLYDQEYSDYRVISPISYYPYKECPSNSKIDLKLVGGDTYCLCNEGYYNYGLKTGFKNQACIKGDPPMPMKGALKLFGDTFDAFIKYDKVPSGFCAYNYGPGAFNTSIGSCDCYSGYYWQYDLFLGRLSCKKKESSAIINDKVPTCTAEQYLEGGKCVNYHDGCRSSYGDHSLWTGEIENGKYICGCAGSYDWNADGTSCIIKPKECPYGQSYRDLEGACIDNTKICQDFYGQNSTWINNLKFDDFGCNCKDGFSFSLSEGRKTCVTAKAEEINLTSQEVGVVSSEIRTDVGFDAKLTKRMMGNILLQIESHGEAWYVEPKTSQRFYMKDGITAYQMMRSFGQGITDNDLGDIPSVDTTDEIKNASSICLSNSLANRLKGKILLQVQQHGEAYYVYPKNCRMIYMKDGTAAYEIMRYLGLGITNADLEKIPANE